MRRPSPEVYKKRRSDGNVEITLWFEGHLDDPEEVHRLAGILRDRLLEFYRRGWLERAPLEISIEEDDVLIHAIIDNKLGNKAILPEDRRPLLIFGNLTRQMLEADFE